MASNSEQQLASFTVLSFESLLPSSFLHVTAAILVFGSLLCLYVWPRLPGQRLQILSSVLLELEHAVAYSLLPNSYFQVEVTVSLTRIRLNASMCRTEYMLLAFSPLRAYISNVKRLSGEITTCILDARALQRALMQGRRIHEPLSHV